MRLAFCNLYLTIAEKSVIDDISHLFHLLVDEELHCCKLYYRWEMKKTSY